MGEKKEDDEGILFYNLLQCMVVPGIWSGRDASGLLGDGGGDLHITVASGDDAWGAGRAREQRQAREKGNQGEALDVLTDGRERVRQDVTCRPLVLVISQGHDRRRGVGL